jgi:4-amino-4-deoxy-L-arabinose transferase-like glycosyltransferase
VSSPQTPTAPRTTRPARLRASIREAGPAYWILAALVVIGIALRVVASLSWWPAITTLADSWPYAAYANSDPFGDPQHPAGYPLMLGGIGLVSQSLPVTIIVQHVLGIASALLLFAAVRRMTGSPWPALVPAALVLLNADQIFMEHTIMSEAPFVAVMALAVYVAVRAVESPDPWWRWPAAAGALIAIAAVFRSAALFFLPVVALAILLARPRPWLRRWRGPVAAVGVGAIVLLGYAFTNLAANDRFEVGPTQGWHLYGRVAGFADCGQFTPPKGTVRLCESNDPDARPGGDYYLYDPASPALRLFGPQPWEKGDAKLGAWARQAVVHQPKTYALAVWRDLRSYFVPSARVYKAGTGGDLDPQLDWTAPVVPGYKETVRDVEAGMQVFYHRFHTTKDSDGLTFLHGYQRIFRFGATALTICTLLSLLGLLMGPRRGRVGVLLFGIGGLSLLAAPTLSVYYTGRYTVPVAPLIAAGAAITVWALWRMEAERRRSARAVAPS